MSLDLAIQHQLGFPDCLQCSLDGPHVSEKGLGPVYTSIDASAAGDVELVVSAEGEHTSPVDVSSQRRGQDVCSSSQCQRNRHLQSERAPDLTACAKIPFPVLMEELVSGPISISPTPVVIKGDKSWF